MSAISVLIKVEIYLILFRVKKEVIIWKKKSWEK